MVLLLFICHHIHLSDSLQFNFSYYKLYHQEFSEKTADFDLLVYDFYLLPGKQRQELIRQLFPA